MAMFTHGTSALGGLAAAALLLATPLSAAAETPGEGDLVITEILIAPPSGSREYFEVQNVSGQELDLLDCVLDEGHYNDEKEWTGNDYTVQESVLVPDGERAVLMYGTSTDDEQLCAAWQEETLETCLVQTAMRYRSLGLNNSEPETLSITCDDVLVDSVDFDWGDFSNDCPEEYDDNCTVNLHPDSIDATSNDDPSAWCVPWQAGATWDHSGAAALNTAGSENLCYDPEPWCEPGEAIISELMIAPPDGYKEWVEIYGAADTACNIGACTLKLGESSDPTYEPTETDGWTWDLVELEVANDLLMLGSGAHLLLARSSDWITGDGEGKADIAADLNVSGLSLSNSTAEWMHLICGEDTIDSAPVDWGTFEERCPAGNCSVNLSSDLYTAADNDDLNSWCVPPQDSEYVNPAGEIIRATPGSTGACLELDWPAEGEVIFTEVLPSPQGGISEYIELASLAGGTVDLTFCRLQKHRLDEAGELDESSVKSYTVGKDERSLSIESEALQLLSYSDCLFAVDTAVPVDSADDGVIECDQGEFPYSTIQLSADEDEHLSLFCPDGSGGELLVDTISFHASVLGLRDGHSLMLDPDLATATYNDEASSWCPAAYSQKIDDLSDDLEDCNYGTPGALDPCLEDQPEPLQPVCRCSSQRSSTGAWVAGLLALAAAALGRRRRRWGRR